MSNDKTIYTELHVADPKLPCKIKLLEFYHSQSSNNSFYHDHPKKLYDC